MSKEDERDTQAYILPPAQLWREVQHNERFQHTAFVAVCCTWIKVVTMILPSKCDESSGDAKFVAEEERPPTQPQKRHIFPSTPMQSTLPNSSDTFEGESGYIAKLKEGTPFPLEEPAAPKHTRDRTHSDPDTFAAFTASEGSTFGKSESYNGLASLGDESNDELDFVAEKLANASLGDEESPGMNYSSDEDAISCDQPLNDEELCALSHPLAAFIF